MALINERTWVTQTAAVNNVVSPNAFLQKLLYANGQTVGTEDILIDVVSNGRPIAPFVRKNGEAIMVPGTSWNSMTVSAPNIRIKMPFNMANIAFTRQPGGSVVVTTDANPADNVNAAMARDVAYMADMVTNAEEYLVAMALQGVISYSVADQEVITITIPRAAGNTITLSTFWNDANPDLPRPLANLIAAKRVAANATGLQLTDAICGSEASAALMALVEAGKIKMLGTDGTNVRAGTMTFVEQFRDDGVLFLGELGGIRFWEYARQATLPDGTVVNMIRPKYVEFVSNSASAERTTYYGAILDFDALDSGLIKTKRFAKEWTEKDPSRRIHLVASRPLPWPRKVDASVSMKVVSG